MADSYPMASIIVLNWNGLKDTMECIESLENLTYPNYEILLVDNGSTDGSQEAVKERFPEVVLVQNETNLGFAAGLGQGIKYASAEYIAFLNNDTVVERRWLDELIRPFLTTDDEIVTADGLPQLWEGLSGEGQDTLLKSLYG